MTDYVLRHINRTRIISLFRHKLIVWKTVLRENAESRVDVTTMITDNALCYGQALGYLTGISDYLPEYEIDLLQAELDNAREENNRRVNNYVNYYKYMPKP